MKKLHYIKATKRIAISIVFLLLHFTVFSQDVYTTILDDFDELGNWPSFNTTDLKAKVSDGKYVISNTTHTTHNLFETFRLNHKYSYIIETSFCINPNARNAIFSFVWGDYLDSDYMKVQFDGNKKVTIRARSNDNDIVIKAWSKCNELKDNGEYNILQIKKLDNKIRYYINDKLLFITDNYSINGTELGFSVQDKIDAKVDYLKIFSVQTEIQVVDDDFFNTQHRINMGKHINSQYSERTPVISPNGRTLYIARRHPDNFNGLDADDIWYSTLNRNNEWTPLKHAGYPINNSGNNFVISVTENGNSLLLGNTYRKNGKPGESGISISKKIDGVWQIPQKQTIEKYTNIDKFGSFFLSSDGKKLIVCAETPKSQGDLDLYISFLIGPETWSEPKNMGNVINTFAADFAPFLAADDKTMYFSSYGHNGYGSSDIFVSTRLDDTWKNWSTPKNLGPNINTDEWDAYYTQPSSGNVAYMVSTKKTISYGKEDVFEIGSADNETKREIYSTYQGSVYDLKTMQKINARITYKKQDAKNSDTLYSTVDNGYELRFKQGDNYIYTAEADGYYPVSNKVKLKNESINSSKHIDLYMIPIE